MTFTEYYKPTIALCEILRTILAPLLKAFVSIKSLNYSQRGRENLKYISEQSVHFERDG